ncbi:hypothetical protein PENSPDRAFT_759879 [Peniophora sp. CONT]|nr:hypothetical protein PENSPDRAFT_759879 [Peniophora sp. CONT]
MSGPGATSVIDPGTVPVPPRFQISENLKRSTKGTVATAVEILGVAATATQNVPYLGIISSILAEVMKIYREVDTYKTDWKAVAGMAEEIKSIVDDMRTKFAKTADGNDEALPEAISRPFVTLERCLVKVLETLNACIPASNANTTGFTKKMKGFAREVLNRGDLSDKVKQCRADMQAALDLFNTRLLIEGTFTMRKLVVMIERWGKQLPRSVMLECVFNYSIRASLMTALRSSVVLPVSPKIFHGRALEVDHIVDLLLHKAPARVAILGSGGIGKTSIALTVLHHKDIEHLYSDRRYFLPCTAISTSEGIILELLNIFGLDLDQKGGIAPRDMIISYLRALPNGLLCLDNVETPWDADVEAVETLLAQIASLPQIAIIITTRGGDRPMQVAWTKPFLPQIAPLSFDAASNTWIEICGSRDVHSDKLIQAVDCVPLAVVLLANLAQSVSTETLWTRWESEQTKLLRGRGPENHLNSVETSIQLSLQGPRFEENPAATDLLSVLCNLPQGMLVSHTPAFAEAFKEHIPSFYRSETLLKQCSLAYVSEDGYLRVLSPIRHYMLAHHPISGPFLTCLSDIYYALLDFPSPDFSTQVLRAKKDIRPELGNISTVMRLCLQTSNATVSERILLSINSFAALCHAISIYDVPQPLLAEAITRTTETDFSGSAVAARLRYTHGHCLYYQDRESEAVLALSGAYEMYRQLGDQRNEAECQQTLADCYTRLGKPDEAERRLNSALGLYLRIDDRRGQVETLHKMCNLYNWLDRLEDTENALQRALDLALEVEDQHLEAHTMRSLGDLYANPRIQRYEEAGKRLRSARALYVEIGDRLGEAHALKSLGSLYEKLKQLPDAESTLRSALEIYHECKNRSGEANTQNVLGLLYIQHKQHDDAIAALHAAYDLSVSMSDILLQGNAKCHLGMAYVQHVELDRAERCFEQALQLFKQANHLVNANQAQKYLDIVLRARQPNITVQRPSVIAPVSPPDPGTADMQPSSTSSSNGSVAPGCHGDDVQDG